MEGSTRVISGGRREGGGGRWETTRVFVRDLRVFKSLGIELKVNTKAVVVGVSSRV